MRVVAALLLLVVAYLGTTYAQVVIAARDGAGDVGPATQAIIVLGAAQYDGRPSPVLEARLEHAVTLYDLGVAPVVVVTGGQQPGDRSREATVSAAYLLRRGVPEEALRREVDGANTWEQLAASARFLATESIDEVVLVSDPLHTKRLSLTADEVGLRSRVSAAPDSRITGNAHARMAVRETLATAAGRIVGFRRLRNLEQAITAR
ncbi:MAG: YdcF family protein [Egibacteraceae bacterium]